MDFVKTAVKYNNVSRETFPIFGLWTQDNVSRETIKPNIL